MTNEMIKSVYALMQQNEEVGAKLANIKAADEAISILAENGINVTEEDLKEMVTILKAEELPEDLLDMVAGGGPVADFFWGFCDGLVEGWNATVDFFKGLKKG